MQYIFPFNLVKLSCDGHEMYICLQFWTMMDKPSFKRGSFLSHYKLCTNVCHAVCNLVILSMSDEIKKNPNWILFNFIGPWKKNRIAIYAWMRYILFLWSMMKLKKILLLLWLFCLTLYYQWKEKTMSEINNFMNGWSQVSSCVVPI